MKKDLVKKSIGLILSMAMMAGLMWAYAPVEAKAAVHSEPQAGDTVKLDDNSTKTIGSDIDLGYVIVTKDEGDWDKDLKVYVVWDATFGGGYSPQYNGLQWNDGGYWESMPSPNGGTIEGVKSYVISKKADLFTKSSIDSRANTGFAYYWISSPSLDSSKPVYFHTHNYEYQVLKAPSVDADGEEGEVCTICGATKNIQPLSAFAYALYEYAIPMINSAKPGQTITFEFKEWNSFPKAFMEKIAAKNDVTYVFHYNWNHQKQEITIPAGTPIDLNFDYYGPAKMAELYGMY